LEAGDLGHSNALCSAGAMFFHGLGTERNFTKSYQLYQHAVDADSENKEAWRNLASCYYHGHGTKKDVKLAKTILDTVLKDE
jgi:TPR repeat protein